MSDKTPAEKVMKMMRKVAGGDHAKLVNAVSENLADLDTDDIKAQVLTILSMDLVQHVNQSAAQTAKCADPLLNMSKTHAALFKTLAGSSDSARDAVGFFLTEALRCNNFARHDSAIVATFIEMIEDAGIKIAGDPKTCIKLATFAVLDFGSGVVTMQPT